MNIEFIGHPGTGKSRVCDALSDLLLRQPIETPVRVFPAVDREPRVKVLGSKILHASLFLVLRPATAFHFVSLVRTSGQASRRKGAAKTLNLFSEIGRELRHRGEISVREQGVLQAVWSVALGADSPDTAGLLHSAAAYLPDFVVHVEAERSELHRRLERRASGRSRMDGLSAAQREPLLQKGDLLFSEIIAEWQRLDPHHRYLKIQNPDGSDADALAALVFEALPFAPAAAVGTPTLTWTTGS
ncbi:MAG: hypothetical protein WD342_12530 [Verrucomicrobiales bacterium]